MEERSRGFFLIEVEGRGGGVEVEGRGGGEEQGRSRGGGEEQGEVT